MQNTTERKDVYSRITAQIVEHLERGVRPWTRPWNAEHAAGRITRCGPQKPRAVDEMPRVRCKWPEFFLSCVQRLKVAVRS